MKDCQSTLMLTFAPVKERDNKLQLLRTINKIQNDSVKHFLIPVSSLPEDRMNYKYLNEAEMLNRFVFGCSSTQWRKQNPEFAARGFTIRSQATMERLQLLFILVISNRYYLEQGLPKETRIQKLSMTAAQYSIPANHILR